LLVLAGTTFSFGQYATGRLYITLYRQNYSYDDSIRYALSQDGSVIRQGSLSGYDYLRIDSVPEGTYTVSIYVRDTLNVQYPGVVVRRGETTSIDALTTNQEFQESKWDTVQEYMNETNIFGMYGPKKQITDTASPFKDTWMFGLSEAIFWDISRYYAPGFTLGTNAAWTRFDKNGSLDSVIHSHERYFALNLSAAFMNRFTFYDARTVDNMGITLDLGIEYNYPLMFRHAEVDGNQKLIERKIHRLNDLSVIARFGYTPVMLVVEYRILDYLKSPYPQVPPLRIGFTLVIPNGD
jgi:hypothetical protein